MTQVTAGGRGSGKTTRAILEAPRGALFIWCNRHLDYPRRLAKQLGRDDLRIASPESLEQHTYAGLNVCPVLDHAATLTERQWLEFRQLESRWEIIKIRAPDPTGESRS